jgi:hypothetical protein
MTVAEAIEKLGKLDKDLELYAECDMGPYKVDDFKLAHLVKSGITFKKHSTGQKIVYVW